MTAKIISFKKNKKHKNVYNNLDVKTSDVVEQFKKVLESLSLKDKVS